MTTGQRAVPLAALLVALLAVGYALLPFRFAGAVRCGAPLFGAEPETHEQVGFIDPGRACDDAGSSRLLTAATFALVAVAAAAGLALVPEPGWDCRDGHHGDCHASWPVLLGPLGRSIACRCPCHQGATTAW